MIFLSFALLVCTDIEWTSCLFRTQVSLNTTTGMVNKNKIIRKSVKMRQMANDAEHLLHFGMVYYYIWLQ